MDLAPRLSAMVEIDGAHGEGGGQLVRTAVALSAVTGVPVRIVDIRARRRRPGLAAQHAAAVQAVAALCDARCEGVQTRSTTLSFWPHRLHGGVFEVDVGTAGSIALVLQAMLPAALSSGQHVEVALRGGTDVPMAPPMDYLRLVLLPLLARMGVQAELDMVRRGYFPQGGGEVRLALRPLTRLTPFAVAERGPVAHVDLLAHVAHLPGEIAQRMAAAARAALPPQLPVQAEVDVCAPELALGPGGAIVLRAVAARTTLGAAAVAARGVPAERLGQAAASSLRRDLDAGATLDVHAVDQMLVFLALADGPCAFRAAELGSHARTVMWLLEKLTPARFDVSPAGAGVLVRVLPGSQGQLAESASTAIACARPSATRAMRT
ncbi:MAG: RNA 3'-terminal phosphate cyclase [Rubrivivax sp.]|nr:RNA 3'-terminal phosphate cyclase [Rubrivivax sp.]